jgi:hypothetical protein
MGYDADICLSGDRRGRIVPKMTNVGTLRSLLEGARPREVQALVQDKCAVTWIALGYLRGK